MIPDVKCLTCVYAFVSQIGEGDVSTGNMTGAHDLQLAPPGQPLSQATGTDTVFMTDKMYSPHLSISYFMYAVYTVHFLNTDQQMSVSLLLLWLAESFRLHSAHCVLMCMNACTAGAPMLSRLLEAGPTQFSAPLGFMVSADSASIAPLSAATPVPVDSTASASTGLSTLTRIQTTPTAQCTG